MDLRTLGRTGVEVSPLCLGAMMFGAWGNSDHDDSIRIIHKALDSGINFVDTADVYSAGENEEIVGKALLGRRDKVVLATKFHGTMGDGPNMGGNSRRWIIQEVENSLRRLQTDWIDLYQIHRPDPDTDYRRDAWGADRPRQAGEDSLLRQLDLSRARDRRGAVGGRAERARAVQDRAAALLPPGRGIERDVLPVCQQYGMGVLSWSPLAGGWLSGNWRKGQDAPASTRSNRLPKRYDLSIPENQRKLDAADALAQLADNAGISLIHLAIAFVIRHPAITSAIIGPRTMEQFESQIGAADIELEDELLDEIDADRAARDELQPRRLWLHPAGARRCVAPPTSGRHAPPARLLEDTSARADC